MAKPGAFPTSGQAPKKVKLFDNGSFDPNGYIVKWEWNFGDQHEGQGGWHDFTATAGTAYHIYANPGTYNAHLRVTDNDGNKDNDKITITITAAGNANPVAQVNATPLFGTAPLEVSFNAAGSLDPDGFLVKWEWDLLGNGTFADYTLSEGVASYTYVTGGTYHPVLRVTDDNGAVAEASLEIYVNQVPNAVATATPDHGYPPMLVSFDGSGSSDPDGFIVKYEWDFGEGGGYEDFGTTLTASHTYNFAGNYTAMLRVTDNAGAQAVAAVSVDTTEIRPNELPVAVGTVTPLSGTNPLSVQFDGSGSYDPDGEIVSWEWDLGDGSGYQDYTASQGALQFTYITPGNYTAILRVTDDDAGFDTESFTIHVNAHPNALGHAVPAMGYAPLLAAFDATGSTDSDGTIVQWAWDFGEGGGFVDCTATQGAATYTYTSVGNFIAALKVTDNEGGQDIYNVPLTVTELPAEEANAICYAAKENGQWGIYTMAPDGSQKRKVCDAGPSLFPDGKPAWSPDHSKIVWYEVSPTCIWVVNVDGTGKHQVTTSQSADPYWEDNEWILYDAPSGDGYEIWRIRQDGTDSQLVFKSGDGLVSGYPYISADGKHITFAARPASYGSAFSIYSADYPGFANVTLLASPGSSLYPVWTSTNDIYFNVFWSGIWKMNSDGSGLTALSSGIPDGYPVPSPDESVVLFTDGSAAGHYNLWKMNADGTNRLQLTAYPDTRGADWYHTRLPKAVLSATPATGSSPLVVSFNATASYDMDNGTGDGLGIAKFEWDFDGDGVFEYDSGLDSAVTHNYAEPGVFTATVRATDDDSESNTTSIQITVSTPEPVGIWSMYGHDVRHTRQSPYSGPTTNALKWSFTGPREAYASPAIASDGTIYQPFYGGILYAFNTDGSPKWVYNTGSWVSSSPAIGADGVIYFGDDSSNLVALNEDGSLKWRCPTGGAGVYSSPAIASDGTIYVGNWSDYRLYAINPNGTIKWSYPTQGRIHSSPAISSDGTIYIGTGFGDQYYGTGAGAMYAFNPDGTLQWKFDTGGFVWSSPAIATDGTVYFGSDDHIVYALNPDGSVKWQHTTGDVVESSPGIANDGTMIIGSNDRFVYAFNPNGSLKWSYATSDGIGTSGPAIDANGNVYIGSGESDSSFYALNRFGELIWSYATGDVIPACPAIGADGTVYIGSYDYKLYAFHGGSSDTDSALIYFPTMIEGQWTIQEMRSDGSGLRQVCTSPGEGNEVVLSPDESKLAFDSTNVPGGAQVFVVDIASGVVTQVTNESTGAAKPCWEGNEHVLCATPFWNSGDLIRFRIDGTDRQVLYTTPYLSEEAAWISPDGTQIVFSQGTDYNRWLAIADYPSFNNVRTLVDLPGTDSNPCWGSAHQIVWNTQSGALANGDGLIWRINDDGTGLIQLSPTGSGHILPRLNDSSTALLFVDFAGGVSNVWAMNIDGTGALPLTNNGNCWGADW